MCSQHCKPATERESKLALPRVATRAEWQRELDALRIREKAATRTLDAIAALRRRLPIVPVSTDYPFEGPQGAVSLLDLFEGRRQLIIYHFMYPPHWDAPCPGCSRRMDDVGHLAHLNARQTTFAAVARAPYDRLAALWQRKGWNMPVYSLGANRFSQDMGLSDQGDEDFGLSVFLRDDSGRAYRSYFTNGRGVEPAGFRQLLDLTPYGRQEEWEDSPAGWPQSPTHGWGSERDE